MSIEISVIIATRRQNDLLISCLSTLSNQAGETDAELLVVQTLSAPVAPSITQAFPAVNFITCAANTSLAEMKAIGIRQARGNVIALTQPHCIPSNNWLRMHINAHRQLQASAIGGAVINRSQATISERCAFRCEYGKFNSNRLAGVTKSLASSNVSYKKGDLLEVMDGDYWETELHRRLSKLGSGLWYLPEMNVVHQRRCSFLTYLLERFHYSRYFAARRFENRGVALMYAVGCTLLPAIVLIRLLTAFSTDDNFYAECIVCIPCFIAISIAWTAGEFIGYIFGSGHSEKYFG